jgi:hypothetical protein
MDAQQHSLQHLRFLMVSPFIPQPLRDWPGLSRQAGKGINAELKQRMDWPV